MSTRRLFLVLFVLLSLLGLFAAASPAHAVMTFTVNSTADDDDGFCQAAPNDCTLREAIVAANAQVGLDKIQFDLGAGVPTINVETQLPQITDRVIVNGNTGGATRIELTGPAGIDAQNGLVLSGSGADGSVIRKLVINGFGGLLLTAGIVVSDADDVTLTGNYLGTDETGLLPAAEPNDYGIRLLEAQNAVVGGATAGLRNVISSNFFHGIFIGGGGSNHVLGNRIGTDRNGLNDLGNGLDGVQTSATAANVIGTTNPGEGNVISGNGNDGIHIGDASQDQIISGNLIGIGADSNPLPNGSIGVGVLGESAVRNDIFANQINHNGQLGIDLRFDGPTPNDQLDADEGENQLQNFPVITGARALANGTTQVNGRIRTQPNSLIEIWVYGNPQPCDGLAEPEAQTPLGVVTVTTDAEGRGQWVLVADVVPPPPGSAITATATSPQGSTSEISPCEPMQP